MDHDQLIKLYLIIIYLTSMAWVIWSTEVFGRIIGVSNVQGIRETWFVASHAGIGKIIGAFLFLGGGAIILSLLLTFLGLKMGVYTCV